MTLTALSNTIARAILATIERDGICNLGNIEETVFRELAVAKARQNFPAGLTPDDDIRRCAQELVNVMLRDTGPTPSAAICKAHHYLAEALRK